jgi:hypothetical protein
VARTITRHRNIRKHLFKTKEDPNHNRNNNSNGGTTAITQLMPTRTSKLIITVALSAGRPLKLCVPHTMRQTGRNQETYLKLVRVRVTRD